MTALETAGDGGGGRTFVIVHGGWGGGWEWTPVAELLRERGHRAFTPTLSGLGERRHVAPDADLSTHVDDVAAVLEHERLDDVILCGASYSGMVVTGVADRLPERIGLVVYIDAFVPEDGESTLDLMPEEFGELPAAAIDAGHTGFPIPEPLLPPRGRIDEGQRRAYIERLCEQPARSAIEPLRLRGGIDGVARAFVRCTGDDDAGDGDPIEAMAERARAKGFAYRELDLPHDPHLFDPPATAATLDELAASAARSSPVAAGGPAAR